MPEVSVIVPNYNHAPFLKKRIDSILGQTYSDYEIIILDDCSTDASKSIIEQYRSNEKVSQIIFNEYNSGSAFIQWKKGFDHAKGKYIWIAESDDFADATFLECGVRSFQNLNVDLFYCRTVQVDVNGMFLRNVDWWLDDLNATKWATSYIEDADKEVVQYLVYKNFLCNASSILIKKEKVQQDFLVHSSGFKFCGDWLFWLNYFSVSKLIAYSTNVTNYWRDHENTTRVRLDYERNREMIAIMGWAINHHKVKQPGALVKYFFKNHVYKIPRVDIIRNLELMLAGSKYSVYMFTTMIQYYLNPQKFIR